MKKFVRKIGIVFVIVLGLFYVLDMVFTSVFKKDPFYKPQWLYQLEQKEYDFAILGNSRPLTGIDVEYLEELSGSKGLNISISDAQFATMVAMLKIFIERGNTVKTLYLNIDSKQITDHSRVCISDNKFFPLYDESYIKEHFLTIGGKQYMYAYVPFVRYAEYNFNWGVHQLMNASLNLYQNKFDAWGTKSYKTAEYVGSKAPIAFPFDKINSKDFDELLALCVENDIQVRAFTMPYASVVEGEVLDKGLKNLTAYCASINLSYDSYTTDWNGEFEYFKDPLHLNDKGTKLFTQLLFEKYMKKSKELTMVSN